MSKRILIVVGDGGESYETWFAVHRFQEAGWTTAVAAPTKKRLNLVMHDFEPGWDTFVERPGYGMESDLVFGDVKVADYDAVLCIGGRSPEYLRNDPRVLAILREFDQQGKWIFSICHGIWLLACAGLLQGRTVTSYEQLRPEIERSGGTYVARDAVRDGRIISAQTWVQHPAFYREIFKCLEADGRRPDLTGVVRG